MRSTFLACSAALALLFASSAQAQEEIQPETIGNASIPAGTEMLFSVDIALNNIVDGRAWVMDAKTLKLLGIIPTASLGMVHAPDGGGDIYIATTHLSRTTRGTRSDFVEVYSGADLTFKEEIPISVNRAQALNYRSLLQSSSDKKYLFIQNATPATSVSIVDLAAKKQVGEIPNPGCYGIFPSFKTPNRFATTCGDGTFGTIDVKADGAGEMKASGPIFDADADALFSGAFKWGDKWVFASYGGNLYVVDVEGETATLSEKIPVSAGIEGDWRPGGYQPFAVHSASGIAYLAMHKGGTEGSHKNPAEEFWAFDMKEKKLLGRVPAVPSIAMTISQGDKPVLFALDALKAEVARYEVSAPGQPFALTAAGTAPSGQLADQIEVR